MEIVCEHCNTRHYLSDDRIPLETKIGKCKQCSAPITVLGRNATVSIEPTPIQSTPPEQEATKNCDFCGEKILAIAKKCRYCGCMLDGSHAANSQAGEKPPEDVTPPRTDNVVDNTLSYKVDCIIKKAINAIMTEFKKIVDEVYVPNISNIAKIKQKTSDYNAATWLVILIIISLAYLILVEVKVDDVKVDEVVTTTIQEQNSVESYVKQGVLEGLKDPDSAKFGKFTLVNENKACMTVNAKNTMGGYTGNEQAFMTKIRGKWTLIMMQPLDHESCIEIQQDKNEKKDEKKDGLNTSWYKNGRKKYEENYKDGKLDGLSTYWSENGKKIGETNYKNGGLDGLSTQWSENGQKESEVNYKDGLPIE